MSAGFFLIHAKPHRAWAAMLSWLLFAAGIAAYLWVAEVRHRDNPEDRVTPTVVQMATGMYNAVMQPAEEDEAAPPASGFYDRLSHSMLWRGIHARHVAAALPAQPGAALARRPARPAHGTFPLHVGVFFPALRALLR